MNHKQMHRKRGMKNKFILVVGLVLIILAGIYAYYYDYEDLAGQATVTPSPTPIVTTFDIIDLTKTKWGDIQTGWKVNDKIVKDVEIILGGSYYKVTFDDDTSQSLRIDTIISSVSPINKVEKPNADTSSDALKYAPIENIAQIKETTRESFTFNKRKYDFSGGWYSSTGYDPILGQVGFFMDPYTGEEVIVNSLGVVTVWDYNDAKSKNVDELKSNLLKDSIEQIKELMALTPSLFIKAPEKPKERDFFSYETFEIALSFAKDFQGLSGLSSSLFMGNEKYLADYRQKANAFWDKNLKPFSSSGLAEIACEDLINIPNKNSADVLFTTTPSGTLTPSVSINGVRLGSPDGRFLYRIQAVVNIPPSLISVIDNSGQNPNDINEGTTAWLVGYDVNRNPIPLITEDGTQEPHRFLVQSGLMYAGEKAIVLPYSKVKLDSVCIHFSDKINFFDKRVGELCNSLSSEFEPTIVSVDGTTGNNIDIEQDSGAGINPLFS